MRGLPTWTTSLNGLTGNGLRHLGQELCANAFKHDAGSLFSFDDLSRRLCSSYGRVDERPFRRSVSSERGVVLHPQRLNRGIVRPRHRKLPAPGASRKRQLSEYLDGPFQFLDNRWAFEPAPDGCNVDFYISYELKSLMLQLMVGAVFERAFRRFTEAFEQRAQQIYGGSRSGMLTSA